MHIFDLSNRFMGGYGIVGGNLPLACGLALASDYKSEDSVTVCMFGDGASNQGTFHESLNLAAIWKLPVVFVCENNGYAEATPVAYHCSVTDIASRAGSYDIPGVVVDGLDLFSVYEAAGEAIARARRGEGPTLIEAKTYRFYGHFQGDTITYRTDDELSRFKLRDPIIGVRKYGVDSGLVPPEDFDAIDTAVRDQLDAAWDKAKSDPFPEGSDALLDVYVSY